MNLGRSFIHVLWPSFKLLATKIYEITEESNNFINKNELVREDKIGIISSKTPKLINLKTELLVEQLLLKYLLEE